MQYLTKLISTFLCILLLQLSLITPPSLAKKLPSKIRFPNNITAIGLNSAINKIYVGTACDDGFFPGIGQISIIDGLTNVAEDEKIILQDSFKITEIETNPQNNKLYVVGLVAGPPLSSSSGGNVKISYDINIYDGSNNQLIKNINAEEREVNLAINLTTNLVYISNYPGAGSISIIDGITNDVSNSFNPEIGDMITDIAVNQATNKIYIADTNGNIAVIDGNTNTKLSTINLGATSLLYLAVNYKTNTIYVSAKNTNKIYIIDGGTDKVIDEINIVQPLKIAVNEETNRLYVYDNVMNAVCTIDLNTNKIVSVIILGWVPNGIAVHQSTNKIYVTVDSFGEMFIIDGSITISKPIKKQVLDAINKVEDFKGKIIDRRLDKRVRSLARSLRKSLSTSPENCSITSQETVEKLDSVRSSLGSEAVALECSALSSGISYPSIKQSISIIKSAFSIDENKNDIADICEN